MCVLITNDTVPRTLVSLVKLGSAVFVLQPGQSGSLHSGDTTAQVTSSEKSERLQNITHTINFPVSEKQTKQIHIPNLQVKTDDE